MMEAVFQVQGLSVSEWSMLSQLVETPVLSLTPQSRKMMLSDVRALSIGMPILGKELAWVVETLQGARVRTRRSNCLFWILVQGMACDVLMLRRLKFSDHEQKARINDAALHRKSQSKR